MNGVDVSALGFQLYKTLVVSHHEHLVVLILVAYHFLSEQLVFETKCHTDHRYCVVSLLLHVQYEKSAP